MENFREKFQSNLEDYILKTNEELIQIISAFGCGITEFHTADIELLIMENIQLKNENDWIDIEKQKPLAWEKGEWDGNRTDFVLIANDKSDIPIIARAYENTIGATYTLDWYEKNDYEIKGNVTHWKKLPKHPVFQ